ncbi:hypothetical protein BCR35DRAFT_328714 [Leucosporidium creatinivorum]|uniref:Uncharacterized protein n=1 Tax=Leucosporidium creatinivorum TaxID=106004 RepID=A0A1Y2G2N8_9BASI|nr:hypothetical protein BCR35DRAFT_328714 [Leucosporidium creatinivorum]
MSPHLACFASTRCGDISYSSKNTTRKGGSYAITRSRSTQLAGASRSPSPLVTLVSLAAGKLSGARSNTSGALVDCLPPGPKFVLGQQGLCENSSQIRLWKLLYALTSNPAIASRVRILHVYAEHETDHEEIQKAAEQALDVCAEVEELRLSLDEERERPGWIEKAVMRYNRNLVSLSVRGDHEWKPKCLLAMLKLFPDLRTLVLDPPQDIASLPRLESSTATTAIDTMLLTPFLRSSQQSLISIRLTPFRYRQPLDFSPFVLLTRLSTNLSDWHLGENDMLVLFGSIGTVPFLRTLVLEVHDPSLELHCPYLRHFEPTRFLHLLPSTLRRLERAEYVPLSTSYLLSVLNDTTAFRFSPTSRFRATI